MSHQLFASTPLPVTFDSTDRFEPQNPVGFLQLFAFLYIGFAQFFLEIAALNGLLSKSVNNISDDMRGLNDGRGMV